MKRWLFAIPLVLCSVNLLFAGCGSNESGSAARPPPIVAEDASVGIPPSVPNADAKPGAVLEAAPPTASFRVAHLSPDLPAFDVCVLARGTTAYLGPLVGQHSGVEAGAPGVAFSQVSAYLAVAPGQYDVRIVPAGSTTCITTPSADGGADADTDAGDASADDGGGGLDPSSVRDITNLPALALSSFATLLVAGDAFPVGSDSALTVSMISDDAALAGGNASLRAINAVPSAPQLDFGLGSFGAGFTSLLANVAFGKASTKAGPPLMAVNNPSQPVPLMDAAGTGLFVRPAG